MKIFLIVVPLLMGFGEEAAARRVKRPSTLDRPIFRYPKSVHRSLELNDRLVRVLGIQHVRSEASIFVGKMTLPGDSTPRMGARLEMVEANYRQEQLSETTIHFQRHGLNEATPFQLHSAFGSLDADYITYR
jgi:hypothetical protein